MRPPHFIIAATFFTAAINTYSGEAPAPVPIAHIDGLVFGDSPHLSGSGKSETIIFEGTYPTNQKVTAACGSQRVVSKTDGHFSIEVPFDRAEAADGFFKLPCFTVDDFGEKKLATYSFDVRTLMNPDYRLITYSAGAGATHSTFHFKSTTGNRSNLIQDGTTFKGAAAYAKFGSPYRFGASVYFTPIGVGSGSFDWALYYGINLRASYRVKKKLWDRFTVEPSLGWYWWGMEPHSGAPGIRSVFGPQFFVTFYGDVLNGRIYSFYLKYSPLSEDFSFPDLANHEFAIGGRYPMTADSKWSFSIDLSELNGSFTQNTRDLSLYTLSFGVEKRL